MATSRLRRKGAARLDKSHRAANSRALPLPETIKTMPPAPYLSQVRKSYIGRRAALAFVWLAALLLALPSPGGAATAGTCTEADFATAVDRAGAALRQFNQENAPKVTAALKQLQEKRGWSDQELEAKAITFLHSAEIAALDERANELLTKIDELGEVTGQPDCTRLPELEQSGRDLLATMREKTRLTEAGIAAAMAKSEVAKTTDDARAPQPEAKPTKPRTDTAEKNAAAPTPVPAPVKRQPAAAAAPPTPGGPSWSTATSPAPRDDLVALQGHTATGESIPPPATSEPPGNDARGYSIDEIKAATRGFFGTISTNLAGVIEYAFSNYGRPSAYVLGSEGGGAFLAGARYGKGTLFMRAGGQQQVYWHGPSVGYDFGAEGSRTLFLIYKLESAKDLFRRYGGLDGSAYVLGGVGLTVLKGGPVLMAPIRTGVGLRLGANIGYVRFTRHATWNPF